VPNSESRSLHLHTLDSLIADLVSGRPVQAGATERFVLPDERTRSALDWYRKKGARGWAANVNAQQTEELVDAILQEPPELQALAARPASASNRRLFVKRLEVHRFAGLHKFGTPHAAPENYIHEFNSRLTLFEGRNGSGKTSLLNAIIWALTGELLRPQREPEAPADFDCFVVPPDGGDESSMHKLSPLTPMPNVEQYRPDQAWVPADTWVKLTIVDETGAELPPIFRSQSRSPQGKLKDSPPDLSVLGIDPISARIGTIMPGLLPQIKVGSESELGRAVSQLTGLSALVDLSGHALRAKSKIEKEFVRAKTLDRDQADGNYGTAKSDLEKLMLANPRLALTQAVPRPADDTRTEKTLDDITKQLESVQANAFESARDILGERFEPTNPTLLSDLQTNIDRARQRTTQLQGLASVARLRALRQLTPEQLGVADAKIQAILAEGKLLDALAEDPSRAARTRLYSRVADWIADHPDPQRAADACVVCGGSLENAVDPVTGRSVMEHLQEAAADAALLSQTLGRWAESAEGDLMRSLPETLRSELAADLPANPCDLLRAAIVDELFASDPFRGVLSDLKSQTAAMFDDVVKDCAGLAEPAKITLPMGCSTLGKALRRLDCALRFARWRQSNDWLVRKIQTRVLGREPKEGEPSETFTLTGKLLALEATVRAAQPLSDALVQCGRLTESLKGRRAAEQRLKKYATAVVALANLARLGELADEQVDQLRKTLRTQAADWRSRIYLGAFPDTAHELIDTGMGRKGELELVVQAGGVSAPAQHVTNASALRASLLAFFLAFWEYVLKERGGLTILLLDDPEELLDHENRDRLAAAIAPLAAGSAQLIVTSYDRRFCASVSRVPIAGGIEHLEVHPATRQQPVVRTTPPLVEIRERQNRFNADRNAEEPARNFVDGCRVFFEAKLGDMFDEPAHASWANANPDPTLATFVQRLRPLVRSNPHGMFGARVFRHFVDHPALVDGSRVIVLMNKAHHGRREEIRASDVAQCANDLNELLELVEQMYEECHRWWRRDAPRNQATDAAPPALVPMSHLELDVVICPDLAAFTQHAPSGESQEPLERLDSQLLDNTVAYYLRRPNFGFAAPDGSLAIVEAIPGPPADRQLAIARHGGATFARRVVRGVNAEIIGLTAEVPDPRVRSPKTIFFVESSVAIHQVVGIVFDHRLTVENGQDEAVQVDPTDVLKRVEIAFRVLDDSAVPLALKKQVVLGGSRIELSELRRHKDELVALALDDGSSVFKRVGALLPGELAHLVQFESIGGLGSSQVLSVGKPHKGLRHVVGARAIIGVLYNG
jgi:hypothetical protein